MRAHTKKHHTRGKEDTFFPGAISARDYLDMTSDGRPQYAVNLSGLRYREDYTQKELGDLVGIDQSNISQMERGKRAIGKEVAKRLAKVFKVDYRIFL